MRALRRHPAQLGVAAVVVDVGVRDDDVGDVGRRPARAPRSAGVTCSAIVPSMPGVDEQQPLVADDQPLGEAARAEDGGDPVDPRLDLLDRHRLISLSKETALS